MSLIRTWPIMQPLMNALGVRYNTFNMHDVVSEFYLADMSERPTRPYMVISPLKEEVVSYTNRYQEIDANFQVEVACNKFSDIEKILRRVADATENAPLVFQEPENASMEVNYIRPGECTYEKDLDQWVCAWQWTAKLRRPVNQRVTS